MYQRRSAFHDSPADRAEKIRFKLDGGVSGRAMGERFDGTRSTETVRKAHQHRCVDEPVGRQKLGPDLNLPDHGGRLRTDDLDSKLADPAVLLQAVVFAGGGHSGETGSGAARGARPN